MANLTALEAVDLDSNMLEGEVPAAVSSLRNLRYFDISNNMFSGMVLYLGMRKLLAISLANNSFAGGFPLSFCRKDSLKILDLPENQLSGQVPPCLWSLQHLLFFDLSNNAFSGFVRVSTSSNLSLESVHWPTSISWEDSL